MWTASTTTSGIPWCLRSCTTTCLCSPSGGSPRWCSDAVFGVCRPFVACLFGGLRGGGSGFFPWKCNSLRSDIHFRRKKPDPPPHVVPMRDRKEKEKKTEAVTHRKKNSLARVPLKNQNT